MQTDIHTKEHFLLLPFLSQPIKQIIHLNRVRIEIFLSLFHFLVYLEYYYSLKQKYNNSLSIYSFDSKIHMPCLNKNKNIWI